MRNRNHPRKQPGRRGKSADGWDNVANWYDKLVGVSGHDYHRNVILPTALRFLNARRGERIADICCGQGVLVQPLLDAGIGHYLGVDASPKLIASARKRFQTEEKVSFEIADACIPGDWADSSRDAAVCLMAVHDVADADGLFRSISDVLVDGGRAVILMMHPCFRIPRSTHWGFDHDQKIQFRRVDRYAASSSIPVVTHPSRPEEGETMFHHRPLAEIMSGLGKAGLAVTCCEEPVSHRRSQGGGPFSKAEHRAAQEFPLFLALGAQKIS